MQNPAVRLAVVSASRNAGRVLGLLELTACFDAIIDGAAVTRCKPDPEGFLLAADRLRVAAESCVVVEDADVGLKAARAANMKTVHIGFPRAPTAGLSLSSTGELSQELLESLIAAETAPAKISAPPASAPAGASAAPRAAKCALRRLTRQKPLSAATMP